MRVEMQCLYGCRQFWVDSYDKTKIDCMFVPAVGATEEDETKSDIPTMIYCNPNAGYYEFAGYQTDWIDFYTS
jgi:hypothetical protein